MIIIPISIKTIDFTKQTCLNVNGQNVSSNPIC